MNPSARLGWGALCVLAGGLQPMMPARPENHGSESIQATHRGQPRIAFASKRDGNWEIT